MHNCGICNKPVKPQGGMHGPTGDHWDCYANKQKQYQEKVLNMRQKLLERIANIYAPNRAKGITDTELLAICNDYLNILVKTGVV